MRAFLPAEKISTLTLAELQNELGQHQFAVRGYYHFYTPEEHAANTRYTRTLEDQIKAKTPLQQERADLDPIARTPSPAKHGRLLTWIANSGGVLRAAEQYHDERAHIDLPDTLKNSPR